jgi:hypothetical protein
MDLFTEEDVKIKLVLPFLASLGFQRDELRFEQSFRLTFGRSTYSIETAQQRRSAAARLDILVTRNGTNLFILEVKNDHQPIGNAEIEQATSYARLVHPVAPYAIISNGKDTRIYDTITRKEVLPTAFAIKDRYEVILTDESRYEAQKFFIGYSKKNLLSFCQKQVSERMKTLLGTRDEQHKKFIPDLYAPREALDATVQSFLASANALLGIYGDAGIGKTCAICANALALLNDGHPVLFYRARDLLQGLAFAIAEDFNWEFSSEYSAIGVIKRVTEIFGKEHLIVCIDAVDEWNLPGKVEVLGNFLRQTKERGVKVIITCKANGWSAYLQQAGVPTEIAEAAYRHQQDFGYRLQAMSEKEFHLALRKYCRFYQFSGRFEDRVLEGCKRNPFFLRVIFEVAEKLSLKALTLSSIGLFHEYYRQTRDKLAQPKIGDATLQGIARCLLEHNCESLGLDVIRQSLHLSVTQDLPEELFEQDILERTQDLCAPRVSFYFSLLRDYLLGFHVLGLQTIKLSEYTATVERYRDNTVFNQALGLFYPTASPEKRAVIDEPLRSNATAYLDQYTQTLSALFPNLRSRFAPQTSGEIGFYGELSIQHRALAFYGFRALEAGGQRVQLVPVAAPRKQSNLSYLYGATHLQWRSSAGGFQNLDVTREVITGEIIPQLKSIIKDGLLNEHHNRSLLLEKLLAIVAEHYAKHFKINTAATISTRLPISFEAIEYAMRYERALRVFKDDLVARRLEAGKIPQFWSGSSVSYSYQLSADERTFLHIKADNAAKRGEYVKSRTLYVQHDRVEEAIGDAISALRAMGINEIAAAILPDADAWEQACYTWERYTLPTARTAAECLYHEYLAEYKLLIETNFAPLAQAFPLYAAMPLTCFLVMDGKSFRWRVYECKKAAGENDIISGSEAELGYDFRKRKVRYADAEYDYVSERHLSLENIFFGLREHTNYPVKHELVVLRGMVYGQIESELRTVVPHILKRYGITGDLPAFLI